MTDHTQDKPTQNSDQPTEPSQRVPPMPPPAEPPQPPSAEPPQRPQEPYPPPLPPAASQPPQPPQHPRVAWQTAMPGGTPSTVPMKHSGFGITSFIMSLVIAGGLFIMVMIAGVMETTTPGGIDENSAGAVILGMMIIAGGGLQLVAMVLGLVGLFQKERKKLFAIFGTVISAFTLLSIAGLMLIGMAAS